MPATPALTAYLDTCIVSGLAKNDVAPTEIEALLRILQAGQAGKVNLVTSAVTKREISRIPDQFRVPHSAIYLLLGNVRSAPTLITRSHVLPSPILQAVWHQDPLFAQLQRLLPDVGDAEHTFQAAQCKASHLVTVDRPTFLRHFAAVEQLCGVRLVTPMVFERTTCISIRE
jgi:hypothetical protein